jgi:hypothetical protein
VRLNQEMLATLNITNNVVNQHTEAAVQSAGPNDEYVDEGGCSDESDENCPISPRRDRRPARGQVVNYAGAEGNSDNSNDDHADDNEENDVSPAKGDEGDAGDALPGDEGDEGAEGNDDDDKRWCTDVSDPQIRNKYIIVLHHNAQNGKAVSAFFTTYLIDRAPEIVKTGEQQGKWLHGRKFKCSKDSYFPISLQDGGFWGREAKCNRKDDCDHWLNVSEFTQYTQIVLAAFSGFKRTKKTTGRNEWKLPVTATKNAFLVLDKFATHTQFVSDFLKKKKSDRTDAKPQRNSRK